MDANAHVNNVMYFRYIEHARLHYFREFGFSRTQQDSGVGPILAWADCRFRRPLAYPDTISIGTRVIEIEDDRFMMEAIVVSHKLKDVAAIGKQKLVAYDYGQNQKASLPPGFRQEVEEFERKALGT
ncbi:MAG: acyl-CoA thioesterase [Planctomycetota bacterium]|nr:MAG: acyl-CoA thioesterase [Planctomycetota bacterium]